MGFDRVTEQLIARVGRFGDDFWGFWMLGGMSGGGMGFIFAPERRVEAQVRLLEIMLATKHELETSLPFAMDPVVYDFSINERGTWADLLTADAMPAGYYALTVQPARTDRHELPAARRAARCSPLRRAKRSCAAWCGRSSTQCSRASRRKPAREPQELLARWLRREAHEAIRADLKAGRQPRANRLPANSVIEDVRVGGHGYAKWAGVSPPVSYNRRLQMPISLVRCHRQPGRLPDQKQSDDCATAAPLYFTPSTPSARPANAATAATLDPGGLRCYSRPIPCLPRDRALAEGKPK